MSDEESRLSRITTIWTMVREAHAEKEQVAKQANQALVGLIDRYQGAVYRYLLGAARDEDVAAELFQEFALRIVRGRFSGADPSKGRFRDYLRTSLIRLVTDHHRQRQRKCGKHAELDPAQLPDVKDQEASFNSSWRDELLQLTWNALSASEEASGTPYYSALRLRVDLPELRSADLADRLTEDLNWEPAITASGYRKLVQRARDRFAELLVHELARSIQSNDDARIEEELIDLGLRQYCMDAKGSPRDQ